MANITRHECTKRQVCHETPTDLPTALTVHVFMSTGSEPKKIKRLQKYPQKTSTQQRKLTTHHKIPTFPNVFIPTPVSRNTLGRPTSQPLASPSLLPECMNANGPGPLEVFVFVTHVYTLNAEHIYHRQQRSMPSQKGRARTRPDWGNKWAHRRPLLYSFILAVVHQPENSPENIPKVYGILASPVKNPSTHPAAPARILILLTTKSPVSLEGTS